MTMSLLHPNEDDDAFAAANTECGRLKWQRRSKRLEKMLRSALPYVPPGPLAESIQAAIDFRWDQESDKPMWQTGEDEG